MKVYAVAKNIPQSPKKIRVVARRVSKLSIQDALAMLEILPKRAARPLLKVLQSAVANAVHNNQIDADNLVISDIYVGRGVIRRKPEFRARGRLNWRRSAYSNIRVVLEDTTTEGK